MKARRSMVNHRNTFKYTSPLLLTNKRFTIQHNNNNSSIEDQENIAPTRMDQSASIKRRKLYNGQAVDVTPPVVLVAAVPVKPHPISHQPMDMEVPQKRPSFVFTPPPPTRINSIKTNDAAHPGSLSTPRRTTPSIYKPTIQEVMRAVTVYVEVMTIDEDRSDKIKSVAAAMGARVNDKLYKNTTHVIFREGSMTTYKKALKMNVPLVSVTWLEECRKTLSVADPTLFPPINLEPYERPDLYKRVRKAVPNNGDVATTPERFALKPTRPEDELEKALLEYQQTKLRLEGVDVDSPASTPPPPPSRSASQLGRTCLNFSPIAESTKIGSVAPKTPSSQSSVTPLLRRLMIRNAEEDRRERDYLLVGRTNNNDLATNKPLPVLEETRFDQISMDLSSMWGKDPEPSEDPHQRTDNRIVSMVEDSQFTVDLTGASPESENPPISNSRPSNTTSSMIKALRRQTLLFSQNATMEISPKPAAVKENVPVNNSLNAEGEEEDQESVDSSVLPRICKTQRKSLEEDILREDIVRAKEELLGKAVVINKSDKRRSLLPMSMDTTDMTSMPLVNNKPANRRRTLFNVAAISEGGLTVDDPKKAKTKQATKRRTLVQTPMNSSQGLKEEQAKKVKKSVDVSPIKQQQQQQRQSMTPSQMQRRTTINMGPPAHTATVKTKGTKAGENGKKPGEVSGKSKPPPIVDVPKKRKLFNSALDLSPVSSPVHSKMKLLTEPFSPHTAQLVKQKLVESNAAAAVKVPAKIRNNRRSTLDFQATSKNIFTNTSRTTNNTNNSSSSSAMSLGSGDSASSSNRQRMPKNIIVLTNGQPKHLEFIKELVKRLGGSCSNYEVDTRVTSRTTHLVCFEKKRNMNMLRGVIRGVWLLDYTWISRSDELSQWQREEDFQVDTFGNTLTRVRSERQAFGSNYKMELFSGTGQYFVHEMSTVPVHHVKELIMLCGGIVVDQARDAKYLIGDKARADVQVISPSWVFDCVCQYAFLNHKRYLKK